MAEIITDWQTIKDKVDNGSQLYYEKQVDIDKYFVIEGEHVFITTLPSNTIIDSDTFISENKADLRVIVEESEVNYQPKANTPLKQKKD